MFCQSNYIAQTFEALEDF